MSEITKIFLNNGTLIMASRPPTPRAIERQLRQEACFGCVECGNPIVEYHHIIPWSERKHFDPEHMVALCPTHHREFAKSPRSRAYNAKGNPKNKREGRFNGHLHSNNQTQELFIANVLAKNSLAVFSYMTIPILSVGCVGGESKISIFIPDENFFPELNIRENVVLTRDSDFWDIEFKTNYVKFQKRARSIFLTVDLRKSPGRILMNIEINGTNFCATGNSFTVNSKELPSCKMSGDFVFDCGNKATAFAFGMRNERLLLPNYAQASPCPVIGMYADGVTLEPAMFRWPVFHPFRKRKIAK